MTNTDDHLRNHGFLRGRDGWSPAPIYDTNPVPLDVKPRVHSLALDEDDPTSSLSTVLGVAGYFGIADREAEETAARIGSSVRQWHVVASRHGLAAAEIDRMASAFEHADAELAGTLA